MPIAINCLKTVLNNTRKRYLRWFYAKLTPSALLLKIINPLADEFIFKRLSFYQIKE